MYLKCYLSILLGHFDRLLLATSATKSQEKQEKKTKENREQKTGPHAYMEHKGRKILFISKNDRQKWIAKLL